MRLVAGLLFAVLAAPVARADTYPLPPPNESMIGELGYTTSAEEDTLVDIARKHRLGYDALAIANPAVDRWLPGEGTPLVLPQRYILPRAPREGIVVNIAEFRLYYYPKPDKKHPGRVVETFAISAGREDWPTPNVETFVKQKLRNPAWYPPLTIRREHKKDGHRLPSIVPPGPDNPLGPLAMKLGIPGGYFIHGTSKLNGIGMSVTHGCLRLYPEDMAWLFKIVPEGTKVRVINQPYKAAWQDGVLYFEAHPPLDDDGVPHADLAAMKERLRLALMRHPGHGYDDEWLQGLARDPRGVPVPVPARSERQG
jgi:L,D-transpeptidase ErfK/SrfK